MITTSPSSISAGAACERIWYFERVEGLQPKAVSLPRIIGRRVHTGIAAYLADSAVLTRYPHASIGGPPAKLEQAARYARQAVIADLGERPYYDTSSDSAKFADSEVKAEVALLVQGLVLLWYARNSSTILAMSCSRAEELYYVPLGQNVRLVLRPDVVAVSPLWNGPAPVEIKTVERIEDDWPDTYRHRIQFACYAWAHEADGVYTFVLARGRRNEGRYTSPLVYGYTRETGNSIYGQHVDTTYHQGWKRVRWDTEQFHECGDSSIERQWYVIMNQLGRPGKPLTASGLVVPAAHVEIGEAWIRLMVAQELQLRRRKTLADCIPTGLFDGRCKHERGSCPFLKRCWGTPAEQVATLANDLIADPEHTIEIEDLHDGED
jgi:hypothetical protein